LRTTEAARRRGEKTPSAGAAVCRGRNEKERKRVEAGPGRSGVND